MKNFRVDKVKTYDTGKEIKLKLVETDNSIAVKIDDPARDYFLCEFINNNSDEITVRFWSGDLPTVYKMTEKNNSYYSCGDNVSEYTLKRC